jgi:hypothetical protein
MKKIKITIIRKGEESEIFEWNSVPRKGEVVELGDCNQNSQHVVTNVVHYFRRGVDSKYAEIGLEVEPRK